MLDPHWRCGQKAQASLWAKTRLQTPFVILDTETTGLEVEVDEIVQLALLSSTGEILIDTLIQPSDPQRVFHRGPSGRCAADIHGITPTLLIGAPRFAEVYDPFCAFVESKPVVIYNAAYDRALVRRMSALCQRPSPTCAGIECAMLQYAAWYGAWNPYFHSFRWQKLEAAAEHFHAQVTARAHSAIGDCLRTLKVIEGMAQCSEEAPNVLPDPLAFWPELLYN